MDIILIPGLWLSASSWDPVLPALRDAGHRVHPLTMPGVGASSNDSASIGITDWVHAVVDLIDELTGGVIIVGHSGGGNVAWGAADARPDRISRVIFVDTVPPPPGQSISEFPISDGVVPFPGWDFFDDEDVADLTPVVRTLQQASALSVPARVPSDELPLRDPRRRTIPATLLMGSMDADAVAGAMAQWPPFDAEYSALTDVEVVPIGSGHWPQFSRPERLAELLVAAAR